MLRKLSFVISLVLFSFNFLPLVDAQNMEITVEGAGYRILGPNTITLPNVTASFSNQTSTVDFEDLSGTAQDLEIEDQNGGAAFNVTISATNLSDGEDGTISNTNIEMKNYDGDGDTITVVNGSSDEVSLASGTDAYASLDSAQTLFSATQWVSPGQWRIFPSVRVTVPSGTPAGTYTSTLTFTIN